MMRVKSLAMIARTSVIQSVCLNGFGRNIEKFLGGTIEQVKQ